MTPFELARYAEEWAGVTLETMNGLTVWEASGASSLHQAEGDRIWAQAVCAPGHVALRRPWLACRDNSLTRPDVALFTAETGELDDANEPIARFPDAVIEVVCADYRTKDWEASVSFYRGAGVADVIALEPDPRIRQVTHTRFGENTTVHRSPVTLTLACGCTVTV